MVSSAVSSIIINIMESRKISSTIFACLLEKNPQALEQYYSRDAIVSTLFRALDLDCQTIVLKTLSVNQKNLFLEGKRLKKAIDALKALKLIDIIEERYVLNSVFKGTLSRVLSRGLAPVFEQYERNIIEETNDDKWTQVYAYILKNVSGQTPKHLTKEVIEVLETEGLVINLDDFNEGRNKQQKSFGFGFLVQPLMSQINLFMLYFAQFLLRNNFRAKGDKFDEAELIELFTAICVLHPDYWYISHSKLPSALQHTIFSTLDSVGLLVYNSKLKSIKVSKLLNKYLDPSKPEVEHYKTNIIVENDFKLYAYSSMDYLKYFLSDVIRSLHRYKDPLSQPDHL